MDLGLAHLPLPQYFSQLPAGYQMVKMQLQSLN
jgi:hypothetical protein